MRFKKTMSAILAATLASSVFATVGAVTASADKAATVDDIDAADFSTYTTYDGNDLGAVYTPAATTFKVWAPTSQNVKLRLYSQGSGAVEGVTIEVDQSENAHKGEKLEEGTKLLGEYPMELDKTTGVWSVKVEGDCKNQYYTYYVENAKNPNGMEVVDIYAKAAGVNGNRGMVVDLDSTDPAGWDSDARQLVDNPTMAQVWEVHVKDFSYDPESGVSEANRGKYLAFTELETTLNNAGDVKTCMNYLKDLGINYVQINPMYDYASVNEATGDDTKFNWGYDPKNYNVPEGSYSSNPYDGNVRINEMKQMIQALHSAGIGVIMDVVYNHTFDSETSWFNLTVPKYYYRYKADGSWSNGSGCGNDTASEREMFKKYMVDSVTYWAEEYHIDGFRFDLMGLHDCDTMDAVRESLDKIDTRIIMYGEGWDMTTATDAKNWAGNKTVLCNQKKVKKVSDRIGFFNDDVRDALKGKAFDDLVSPGFVSGVAVNAGFVYESMMGHHTQNWITQVPGQNVVYSCCHDNQTLWDRLVASDFTAGAAKERYDERREVFVKGNKLAGAIEMTSHGIPFILAGEEFARTKYGDHNSYESSPEINKLDWSRTVEYADIVSYYKGFIQIRNAFPGFTDATHASSDAVVKLEAPAGVVAFDQPNVVDASGNTWSNVIAYFNGSREEAQTVTLPATLAAAGVQGASGDVDGDGSVTSADALTILRNSLELDELTDAQKKSADLDGDGKITSNDALTALRISLGLDSAPVPSGDGDIEFSVIADDQTAGITEIRTVSGTVTIPPCSALILVPKSEYDRVKLQSTAPEQNAELIVRHVDKSTGEEFFRTTLKGVEGQAYTTSQAYDNALEYDLDSIDGAASGKLAKGTTIVTYNYVPYPGGIGTLVVKYVDAEGKSVGGTVKSKARAGDKYTTEPKTIAWYTLTDTPENAEGEYINGEIEVVYTYSKIIKSTEPVESTIHVQLADGADFVPYIYIWEIYDPDKQNMNGTNAGWPGAEMKDADGDGWYEATFQNGGGYNCILNDKNLQTADMFASGDIWVTAHGAANNVTVSTEDPNGDSTPKGTVVVKHVDASGKEITQSKLTGAVGSDYKAEPLSTKRYTLDETKLPENAEGQFSEENIEVVYTYTENEASDVIVHVKADTFTPYIWFWDDNGNVVDGPQAKWPGDKMTDADGDGWFEYTIKTFDTYSWIINDGGTNQTGDHKDEVGDVWIVATSATDKGITVYKEKPADEEPTPLPQDPVEDAPI